MLDPRAVAADVLRLRETSLFVIGDALLDVYVDGAVRRVSPEAPVPVVEQQAVVERLGGAADVAANLSELGAKVVLAARVGDDADAARIRELLADRGIDDRALVADAAIPTTRKTRVRVGYQQLVRIDREQCDPLSGDATALLLEQLDAFLAADGSLGVAVADYAKGVVTDALLRAVVERCAAVGVPVIADPKSRDIARYAGVTILKPNRTEAQQAAGETARPEVLAAAVLQLSGARNVVVSLSADGLVAVGADLGTPLRLTSHVVQVADVSGAGDTMVALLAAGAAAGLPLERSVQLANIGAARVCEKLGTATLTSSELLEAFARETEQSAPEKWLADRELTTRVCAAQREDGRRVVFTNGCFDLLHAGHVRLLQVARSLGDVLVVAVNDDDSVRRLKGEGRPVSELDDRVAVLSALACVDFVCAFEEDTPLELLLAMRPDILVKGGDYAAGDVVGAGEIASWGGRVEIVPLLENRSTTRLLAGR